MFLIFGRDIVTGVVANEREEKELPTWLNLARIGIKQVFCSISYES